MTTGPVSTDQVPDEFTAGAAASGSRLRAGVVPLVGIESTPGMPATAVTIITERVPGETLRTTWLAPTGVASALVLVADFLADLHGHGIVHGNLSADHIILDADGPKLCSPHGAVTDPDADSIGLGHCLRSMLDRWARLDVEVPQRSEWERLAERLGTGSEPAGDPSTPAPSPLPLRRAARALERLATADPGHQRPGAVPGHDRRARRPWGLVAAGSAGVVGVLGLVVANLLPTEAADVEVGGHRYQLTAPGGPVVVVTGACNDQPDLVVLDADHDLVWQFTTDEISAEPGSQTRPSSVIEVPGAERLTVEEGEPCPTIWVMGPAGRSPLPSSG
ncbi:MAG: hypothetical protein R2710_18935 [Acidimicrobiales bacterium]